jgi:ABC-type enterobactin transport system permease subunit
VIPLPRASVLAAVMFLGAALGMTGALLAATEITVSVRPTAVVVLVGMCGAVGILMILASGRRWVTALGALVLAVGPGWFGALAAMQVAGGG